MIFLLDPPADPGQAIRQSRLALGKLLGQLDLTESTRDAVRNGSKKWRWAWRELGELDQSGRWFVDYSRARNAGWRPLMSGCGVL